MLASSRFSSNSPDWRDAATAFLEVARLVGGRVIVEMHPSGTPGRPSLILEARLVAEDQDQLVLRVLASARLRSPAGFVGGLEPALLSLAYELDKDLYRRTEGLQAPA